MRRVLIATLLFGLSFASAGAANDDVQSTVLLPSFTTPAAARLEYVARTAAGMDGIQTQSGSFGRIIRLTRLTGTFTLKTVGDDTGFVDFDITFYGWLGDTSSPPDSLGGTLVGDGVYCTGSSPSQTCSGTIPTGARYAIVTLSLGLNSSFRYSSHQ